MRVKCAAVVMPDGEPVDAYLVSSDLLDALERVVEVARDAEYRSDDDREPVRAALEALDALEAKT